MNIFSAHIVFILSVPIISILLVIKFILLRPDVSIFDATDKHLRILDMALFCESTFSQKYAT
jgi:hypothetical protein